MRKTKQVIVFDLDGTVYQDLTFHKHYIHFLLEGTNMAHWEAAVSEFAQEVFCGKHLCMNAFYRRQALTAKTPGSYFEQMEALIPLDAGDLASAPDAIYLGDAWSLVALLGETLGLLEGERGTVIFHRTREKMEEAGVCCNPRLRDAIVNAGTCFETVLLSNSPADTGMEFLRQLGLDNAFSHVGFSVEKPAGLCDALLSKSPLALEQPEELITIGDHALNDLEPLRRLGCQTVWMNPYTGIHEPEYDVCLKTTDELADFLSGLCEETATENQLPIPGKFI